MKKTLCFWQYIAEKAGSSQAADSLLREIDRRISLLAKFPDLGESQPQFGNGARRIIIGNYLVYYDRLDDAIHVLRVFHAARKIEELF